MELLLDILRQHKIFRRVCETKLPREKHVEEKRCEGTCRQIKPIHEFGVKKHRRESICITCRRRYYRMRDKARKEEAASGQPTRERRPIGGRPLASDIIDGRKRCTQCDEWKPADTEHFHGNGNKGLKAKCKYCTNGWNRGRYAAHRDAITKESQP